jgi:hypothetical protein
MDSTGVVIPADASGRRSSSALGRAVVAEALRAVDPVGAAAAERENAWRTGYPTHVRRLVEAGLTNENAAMTIARAGLAALHERMRITTATETEVPFAEAFDQPMAYRPRTRTVRGSAPAAQELSLPLGMRRLRGEALLEQLEQWQQAGVLEPSAAAAVREVAAHPEWLALPGQRIVVLGAGSEMGPLQALLGWGAEVIAVDLPRRDLWRRLEEIAERGAGVLHLPETEGEPGTDLLHDLPAVADWLGEFDGPLVLGNYVYADGAVNLRLSMATDALAVRLTTSRPDVALAYLATPTDVFGVPAEVIAASAEAYERSRLRRLRPLVKGVSAGRLLQPNYGPGAEPGVADAIIPQQGPNYILAKRVQRWRAAVARREGVRVSLTVAPPTRTRSVTRNRALAAAYRGAHHFGVEVFGPATSNVLMAALLVHDLMTGPVTASEPWREEAHQAVHGGLWRGPYAPESALGIALLLGWGSARG